MAVDLSHYLLDGNNITWEWQQSSSVYKKHGKIIDVTPFLLILQNVHTEETFTYWSAIRWELAVVNSGPFLLSVFGLRLPHKHNHVNTIGMQTQLECKYYDLTDNPGHGRHHVYKQTGHVCQQMLTDLMIKLFLQPVDNKAYYAYCLQWRICDYEIRYYQSLWSCEIMHCNSPVLCVCMPTFAPY